MSQKWRDKADRLWLEKRAFIDGKYVDAQNGAVIHKTSPVDGRRLDGIVSCQSEDVDAAVKAAKVSYQSRVWADKGPDEKRVVLYRLADLMEENLEELALIDTLETGRCIHDFYYDSIPKAIAAIRWFAEAVDKYYDHAISKRANTFATITKEPLGVVGLITPWNDPLVVAAWKFAPALLMGNSVVLKPAEQSSLSILKVAKYAQDAGVPDGVFNVVPGYGEVAGKALALHREVDGVYFTGSSEVGKLILQYSGQSNMKKVGLECGGKSPFIVSNKCGRLAEAATVICKNIFYNQGQICSAPSRLIVQKEIKDIFIGHLRNQVSNYVPSDPFDMNTRVGCMISEEQLNRVEGFIEQGRQNGTAEISYPYIPDSTPNRCQALPVIFDDVDPESPLAQQEIFGPVLSIIEAKSLGDAVQIANNSKYGLAASIWTDDLDEAYQVSRLLRAGIVHINSYGEDDNSTPFGGVRESGIGKDKSVYAFEEYSVTKTIWMHVRGI